MLSPGRFQISWNFYNITERKGLLCPIENLYTGVCFSDCIHNLDLVFLGAGHFLNYFMEQT